MKLFIKNFLVVMALITIIGDNAALCMKHKNNSNSSEKQGHEKKTKTKKDPIEQAIDIFVKEHFKKASWDTYIKNILRLIFENYKEEKNIEKTAEYIIPLCKKGTDEDPFDLYTKIIKPAWILLQENDESFYNNKDKESFLDTLYKTAIDENSDIISDTLKLFSFFKQNDAKAANSLLKETLKNYSQPITFLKTVTRICSHEKNFLEFIKNLENLYPAWSDFFPKKYLCNAIDTNVKKLQESRVKDNQLNGIPNIKQLRSLNQMDINVINTFGEKCGLYTIYNLLEVGKIIKSNSSDVDKTLKNYEIPSAPYILASEGKTTQEIDLHNTFVQWVKKQENIFQEATYCKHSEVIEITKQNNDIEKIISELDEKQKQIVETYQSPISKQEKENCLLMIKNEIPQKEYLILKDLIDNNKKIKDKYTNIELTSDRLGDILKNAEQETSDTLDTVVLLTATGLERLTNKEEVEKLLINECLTFNRKEDVWESGHFHEKIKNFRNNGTPIYIVLLKIGHWFCAVMTCKGLYIANSYKNTPYTDYIHIKKLYDYILFGNLPNETVSIVQTDIAVPCKQQEEKIEAPRSKHRGISMRREFDIRKLANPGAELRRMRFQPSRKASADRQRRIQKPQGKNNGYCIVQ